MQDHTAKLGALIGSRICHDLISPIGAISNGLELIELSTAGRLPSPEMALISESCANARARIQLFRLAFGTAGADQTMPRREVTALFDALSDGWRLRISWEPPHDLPRRQVQLALLAILCCETAMPLGGDITVTAPDTGLLITAVAERIAIPDALADVLRGATDAEITPAQVQFPLLRDLAADLRHAITLDLKTSQMTISLLR